MSHTCITNSLSHHLSMGEKLYYCYSNNWLIIKEIKLYFKSIQSKFSQSFLLDNEMSKLQEMTSSKCRYLAKLTMNYGYWFF